MPEVLIFTIQALQILIAKEKGKGLPIEVVSIEY